MLDVVGLQLDLQDLLGVSVDLATEGERLSKEAKATAPDVPWRQITGARDRLIHGYSRQTPTNEGRGIDAAAPERVHLPPAAASSGVSVGSREGRMSSSNRNKNPLPRPPMIVAACVLLAAQSADATLGLSGDPGPAGGFAQTMVFDLTGFDVADMSDFVVQLSPKQLQLVGPGAVTVSIDIAFSTTLPGAGSLTANPGLDLLNGDGTVLATSAGSGPGGYSGYLWYENPITFGFENRLFHGLDWRPTLDAPASIGSAIVTSGNLTVSFEYGDFIVGTVPEPASLTMWALGLACAGFARRRFADRGRGVPESSRA